MKVIFLDVDGVLNGYSKRTTFYYKIIAALGLLKYAHKVYDIFGVRTSKVRRLAKIVRATGAKVVLSSAWRRSWYIPYDQKSKSQKSLEDKLRRHHVDVIDITGTVPRGKYHSYREDEINEWLSKHEVEKFIILDDESFDLQSFVGKELIQTSELKPGEIIEGRAQEHPGLRRKHVKRAIAILNGKVK